MFRINAYISDMRKVIYMSRADAVLNMQLTLIPILAKEWNISFSELSRLFHNYDILSYIDTCYERYNSTGNQGIIDDLRDYIEMQGGSVAWKIWLNLCYKALPFSRRCSFWKRRSCMAHCNDIRTSLRNRGIEWLIFLNWEISMPRKVPGKILRLWNSAFAQLESWSVLWFQRNISELHYVPPELFFLLHIFPWWLRSLEYCWGIVMRIDWSFFWLHFRL